jgi:hypothetical protein
MNRGEGEDAPFLGDGERGAAWETKVRTELPVTAEKFRMGNETGIGGCKNRLDDGEGAEGVGGEVMSLVGGGLL